MIFPTVFLSRLFCMLRAIRTRYMVWIKITFATECLQFFLYQKLNRLFSIHARFWRLIRNIYLKRRFKLRHSIHISVDVFGTCSKHVRSTILENRLTKLPKYRLMQTNQTEIEFEFQNERWHKVHQFNDSAQCQQYLVSLVNVDRI